MYKINSDFFFKFQALENEFFNFETFDVDEYEHYEVMFRHVVFFISDSNVLV